MIHDTRELLYNKITNAVAEDVASQASEEGRLGSWGLPEKFTGTAQHWDKPEIHDRYESVCVTWNRLGMTDRIR